MTQQLDQAELEQLDKEINQLNIDQLAGLLYSLVAGVTINEIKTLADRIRLNDFQEKMIISSLCERIKLSAGK